MSNQSRYRDREFRPGRKERSLVDKIKRDVMSWFDDDEDDGREHVARDRDAWNPASARGNRTQSTYRQSTHMSDDEYSHRGYDRSDPDYVPRGPEDYSWSQPSHNDANQRDRSSWQRNDQAESSHRGRDSLRPDPQINSPYGYTYTEYWLIPGPYSGTGPKGFQRSAESLKEQVCERLESHGGVNAVEIEVEVNGREVTLTGTVPSREQKRQAEMCAESVRGIDDVHNQLKVDPAMGSRDSKLKETYQPRE